MLNLFKKSALIDKQFKINSIYKIFYKYASMKCSNTYTTFPKSNTFFHPFYEALLLSLRNTACYFFWHKKCNDLTRNKIFDYD